MLNPTMNTKKDEKTRAKAVIVSCKGNSWKFANHRIAPMGRLTFRYNDISIQLHLDTRTFRYGPKVSKCQKNLIQMSKDPNVRNHVSKCQKYPNTQCRIEMSKIYVSKCQKYPNVRILSIEMSKGSKCQFLS